MLKYMRKGVATRGNYCGGEWNERQTEVEATGSTLEILEIRVKQMTKELSSSGSRIDFGFIDNTKSVKWDDKIYEVNEYIAPGTQYDLDLED